MPAKDIGIDLGTRNSLVSSTGKGIVLREPSVVVYDKDTEKIRAIGEEARHDGKPSDFQIPGSDLANPKRCDRRL